MKIGNEGGGRPEGGARGNLSAFCDERFGLMRRETVSWGLWETCLNVCVFLCPSRTFAAAFGPSVDAQAPPEKRLEDMMRLGELCIEVLQQNEEHHSEVFDLRKASNLHIQT